MNKTNIFIAPVSTIFIEEKDESRKKDKYEKVVSAAHKYSGRVTNQVNYEDGVFLEVCFKNPELKNNWETEIGIKKQRT